MHIFNVLWRVLKIFCELFRNATRKPKSRLQAVGHRQDVRHWVSTGRVDRANADVRGLIRRRVVCSGQQRILLVSYARSSSHSLVLSLRLNFSSLVIVLFPPAPLPPTGGFTVLSHRENAMTTAAADGWLKFIPSFFPSLCPISTWSSETLFRRFSKGPNGSAMKVFNWLFEKNLNRNNQ